MLFEKIVIFVVAMCLIIIVNSTSNQRFHQASLNQQQQFHMSYEKQVRQIKIVEINNMVNIQFDQNNLIGNAKQRLLQQENSIEEEMRRQRNFIQREQYAKKFANTPTNFDQKKRVKLQEAINLQEQNKGQFQFFSYGSINKNHHENHEKQLLNRLQKTDFKYNHQNKNEDQRQDLQNFDNQQELKKRNENFSNLWLQSYQFWYILIGTIILFSFLGLKYKNRAKQRIGKIKVISKNFDFEQSEQLTIIE